MMTSPRNAGGSRIVAAVLAATALFGASARGVVYVDGTKAGGNGTTWAQAYRTLEKAVASSAGAQDFWIVRGTYRPASTLTIVQPNWHFYGGFVGNETQLSQRNPSANPTIVDGQDTLKHSFFFATTAGGGRLDGLTITRGRARPGSGWDEYGGGAFIDTGPVTVENCTFSDCQATVGGGGLMVNRSPSTISDCLFTGCQSPQGGGLGAYGANVTVLNTTFSYNSGGNGGGIWLVYQTPEIGNCVFNGNQASSGGGISATYASQVVIHDSKFVNNSGTSAGGGIALSLGTGLIQRCYFESNSTPGNGGGVWAYYSVLGASDSTFIRNRAGGGGGMQFDYKMPQASAVQRCLFMSNNGGYSGGGISSYAHSFLAENCVFDGNVATNGGGVATHGGSGPDFNSSFSAVLRNCTICGNQAYTYGGGMQNSYAAAIQLYNDIFWGNSAGSSKDIFNAGSSSMSTRYSDIETAPNSHGSASESNVGRFSSDPLFVDANGANNIAGDLDDNFQLQGSSPCLDHADGNNAPATDIVNSPRFDSAAPNLGTGTPNYADVGAYEAIQYAGTPAFAPDGGSYTSWVVVAISSTTTAATIRYTIDGSDPTASSPIGTNVWIGKTSTLKARAFAAGYADSPVKAATYTFSDTDGDGLPDWVETGTGVYVSPTNTGTKSTVFDTDGDGVSDGIEVLRGSDPNNPLSVPVSVKNDFDGDGRSDLGCYYPPGGNWYFLTTMSGFFTRQFGYDGTLPVSGDFDGDSKADFGCYYPQGGNWYFMKSRTGFTSWQFGYAGTLPVVGDFDGDGKCDYGCYYPPGGNWYLMTTTNGFYTRQFGYAGTLPVVGDFDGDGKCDYGCYYPQGGNWYIMESRAGFTTTQFGYAGTLPIVGDFDGDGKDDYGCYYPPGGNWYIMESRAGFKTAQFGYAGTLPIVGDYDGDGKADYGCYFPQGGNWYIMCSSAGFITAQFGYAGTTPLGGN